MQGCQLKDSRSCRGKLPATASRQSQLYGCIPCLCCNPTGFLSSVRGVKGRQDLKLGQFEFLYWSIWFADLPQTDATFSKFLSSVDPAFRHMGIRTLKVRQTSLSDTSMAALCEMCPNLQRLDVSFTAVRRPSPWLTSGIGPQITKLLLTSTAISGPALLDVLAALTNLTKLSLGALGLGTSPNTSVSNTSAMTLTDNDLYSLTDILASHGRLESLSLVNNAKLGFNNKGKGSLQYLIRLVGRNCKVGSLFDSSYPGFSLRFSI